MGKNKLLVPLAGKPLVRHAVEGAVTSRARPVVVVTGHSGDEVETALYGLDVTFVRNGDFSMGLSTSLKCGLKTLPTDCAGAVILLGDMPNVTSALIDTLIAAFSPQQGHAICVPVARGRRGNPVLWSKRFFPEIMALEGDIGAKALMDLHGPTIREVAVSHDGPLFDIDTLEALAAYKPA
ncbi:MAG: nucleotidyltransferase family protein [Alphaproteobacteria bacterium]|nr:nucleotidyltransferase family protein [Alphaproteobacteria bacterium]MDE2113082.1 nucleotidyltransferase family protein [Alphaproteobacteria bacterium]MDE2492869.1 nucleotidyltransferase family protein [Alphaproteobacteria bacterium]